MNNKDDIIKGGIIGFIVGDAIGVPLEFMQRKDLQNNKIKDMISYRSHNVDKGSWSDDSSMVIATMKSIIDNKGNIDYNDIMNNFLLWLKKAEFTSNGKTFGVGRTTLKALGNYNNNIECLKCGESDIKDNGNGSLMRILPIALYCYFKQLNDKEAYNLVKDISSLTHSHNISVLGCYIYTLFTIKIIEGKSKEESYKYIQDYDYNMFNEDTIKYYDRILKNDISKLDIDNISSMGFVVDTLEAVLWCFMRNDSYDESIIEAINLGNDTDTIGALVGGLSGIYYSFYSINKEWINTLKKKEYLFKLCDEFNDVLR